MVIDKEILHRVKFGNGDSDQHLLTLYGIAMGAPKLDNVFELGVRSGVTTLPLKAAVSERNGFLWSVDIDESPFDDDQCDNWMFVKQDAIKFLEFFEKERTGISPDLVYIDDWHSYDHVKKELEILDRIVSPSTVILIHDLMYGNTCPFYHTDLTLKDGQWANGGPYRAVAELDPQFWEFATLPWNNGLTILRKKYSNKYAQK